ncbi:hypothetical protein A2X44_00700 [candidate division CPR3 bacterium GWF2_35_18]|uniref:Taurine-transporting ATPase n=1 Tax=candidate division CPR3 bacterium GW2011_GWF2_35_18 TaxID=1618350 RepID=A0A0G0BLB6_UNCC3|nr:MAG: Taurine-transporting ATPase [candidate division CPR3 bacterium GW2011_GWF2_35_18]KKP86327.1 MAG: Taurine-transporting ATPase [candidate division CPR3 bacterium GW2011_GWE2_35_7]OGB63429.1 MAG: hypothetical protein A2X44_00700 [candidate division CPR3 bacterium GWF2_35_18]OGB64826.1 MAG: hypothetical protein A2250_05330 [candidate division CPR3 bacterium RIFOXYA2_FULL_35_13]OGB76943.1 MAG: hypothetical protein A2476_05150 [candidate division CPR3 bacterium RIFOXYC2_FULL_35_7]OGB79169.1 
MIRITNLSYTHPSKHQALLNVNLYINKGEFISIIGPSGCGKTTLLKIIADLINDYSGEVLIDGKTPREYRELSNYGYIFQEPNLFPWRTIWQNVNLPLEIKKRKDSKKVDAVLNKVGLLKFKDFYPENVSGGMQQKTALARGLVMGPELLLMDEPFANLDEITKEKLGEELLSIWKKQKQTIVFITHSIFEAVFLSEKVVVMSLNGKIKEIVDIKISKLKNQDLRLNPEFFEYCGYLRKLLED